MRSGTSISRISAQGFVVVVAAWLSATMVTPASAVPFTLQFREGVTPTAGYDVEDSDIRTSSTTTSTEGNPRWNFGVFAGTTYREVAAFPISLPPGAWTVTSVTIDVFQSASGSVGTQAPINLHRITNNNFTNETTVTWNFANTSSNPWTTPGGDFSATVLSTITPVGIVDGTGYTFASSAAFIAAVDGALAGDGILRLLAKAGTETEGSLMSMWASDSGPVAGLRPLLTIEYVPEPTSLGLLAFGAVALCRRRH